MPRRRVLLTGAAGYIAGQLRPALQRDYDLTMLDTTAGDGVLPADLLGGDESQLRALFEGIDTVVHTAYARPPAGVGIQGEYEAQRRNVDMTQRVYQLAVDCGVRRVVVASTNQAAKWYEQPYFAGRRDRVDPEDYPRPDNLYGWAKAAYESLGFLYACGSLGRKLEIIQIRIVVPREIDGEQYVDRPRERYIRELAGYISESDLQQLFSKSIETPDITDPYGVPFHIFDGVSNNARKFWSITNARELIGYQPQDDSEIRFAADIARLLGRLIRNWFEGATPGVCRRAPGDRHRATGTGRRALGDGFRPTDDGRQTLGSGRRAAESPIMSDVSTVGGTHRASPILKVRPIDVRFMGH